MTDPQKRASGARRTKGEPSAGPKRRRGKRRPRVAETEVAHPPRVRLGVGARVAIAAGCLAAAVSIGLFVVYPSRRGPGSGQSVEIAIPKESTSVGLAMQLFAAGLVSNPEWFAFWVRATGGAGEVVAGVHLLTDDASPRELMARLERHGATGTARVTFPEGWNRFEMARRLDEKHVVSLRAFLDATADANLLRELGVEGDSAEGFLFPATYDFPLDDDAQDVVRMMKREFDRRWDILVRARAATLGDVMTSAALNLRDVVTLASMVEKEAVVDDERPVIASVFLNRIRDQLRVPRCAHRGGIVRHLRGQGDRGDGTRSGQPVFDVHP